MNAQQLKNAILQDLYSAKDGWNIRELKDVVADSCPISYGIVQQGNHVDGGVPVVRPVDLHTKYVGKDNLKCTSKDISDSYKRTVLNGTEVLLCVRGTTGIVALATEELKGCNVNRGIVPLSFGDDVDKMFFYYQLQAPFVQEAIEENTMGSALKQINIKDLRILKLRVPPLAEQKRIVAKIEELLPKVEKYGKAQDELNKLNEELPERLKKSILQEAIEGRLVPQDPNDEPASVLLQKIREEKQQLVKAGKLKKKDLEVKPISEDEIPFDIPDSWEWVRHNDLFNISGGSQPPKSIFSLEKKEGYIRLYQIRDYGENPIPVYIPISSASKFTQKGDILLARYGGSLGKVFFAEDGAYNVAMAKVEYLFNKQLFNHNFLFLYYKCSLYQDLVRGSNRSAQGGFNKEDLGSLLFPLPPLAEQKRIVAKIEQLLGEIDKLKK